VDRGENEVIREEALSERKKKKKIKYRRERK
jgi:hypothetical protein